MILLKDLLYEMSSPNLLIPRRVEGRMEKYIQSKIKEYIKNNNVGDFSISGLGLTELPASLKDLKIGGTFFCYNNSLTSLAGGPVSVGGQFYCNDNKLTSLVGAPNSVVGDFDCSDNDLNTLVGGPTSVGGDFWCYNRGLKFTKEQVRAVCDVTGKIRV